MQTPSARRRPFASNLAAACILVLACARATPGQTFTNSTQIRIPATGTGPGPASPYPSNIVV